MAREGDNGDHPPHTRIDGHHSPVRTLGLRLRLCTDLRVHIRRLIEAGRFDVVLDLGGVTFIDSTVVGEIAWTHVALHRRGGRLTLLNPTRRMSRLLSISRLASVIEIRRSGDASALASAGPTCEITRGMDAASKVPVWSSAE